MKIYVYVLAAFLLTGCFGNYKKGARVQETDAQGQYNPFIDAQTGGIRVEETEIPMDGCLRLNYRSDKESVDYTSAACNK